MAVTKKKPAKELRTSLETLDRWLLYRTENDVNDTNNPSREFEPTLRQIERFPIDEIMRLPYRTDQAFHFGKSFSGRMATQRTERSDADSPSRFESIV